MRYLLAAALILAPSAAPAMQTQPRTAKQVQAIKDIWKPAATPKGGTPWSLLETTRETQRNDNGIIYSKPVFTPQVQALRGKQIKVSGWMMPLNTSAKQTRFVLLAYPPGCPFHFHAMPNQFIEVLAPAGVALNERDPMTITGTLQLTGQDESGIFYRMVGATKV